MTTTPASQAIAAPLILLTVACCLAGPAAAMSPACDRIDDPGQRSACHAQDDAYWRWQRWQQQGAQQPHQGSETPGGHSAPLDDDPVYLEALQVRRENCRSYGEGRAGRDAELRTRLTRDCLTYTRDMPARVAAYVTDDARADNLKVCIGDAKAKLASDPWAPLLIVMMDACARRPR